MFNSLLGGFTPKGRLDDNNNRMRYVDIAYFIGILFVLFGHSHPLDDSWYLSWYWHLNKFTYTFHMPFYFFIGGYLMVHSGSIDKIGYSKWASLKLCKFLVPYFVLTVLAYIPKSLLGDTHDAVELSFEYFFKTTFINPRIGVWGHFWFIPVFLLLDLFWGAWRAKGKNNKVIYLQGLILGFLISLALACFPVTTDLYTLYDLSQEAIFYAMGIVVALVKPVIWDKWWKNLIGMSISAIGAYLLYPYANYTVRTSPALNFIIGMLLIWAFWNLAVLISKISKFSFTERISKYFFSIFIYSWPVQATLDAILRRLEFDMNVIILILFISGFIVPILIVNIYRKMRFLHCKFFDYLIGTQTTK